MEEIQIRECTSIEEFDSCVALQKEAFGLPDLEISPRRHLIVSRRAGGWTLAAFTGERMIGFVHHLAAVRPNNEVYGYSHMMAVAKDYQNKGIGARLKWAQREKALSEGRTFIKWTWDPMQSRNAHFNLNRLGVTVDTYIDNFYGTDYFAARRRLTGTAKRSALGALGVELASRSSPRFGSDARQRSAAGCVCCHTRGVVRIRET
jgi:predicted GNAT superfamily acetyltransferase